MWPVRASYVNHSSSAKTRKIPKQSNSLKVKNFIYSCLFLAKFTIQIDCWRNMELKSYKSTVALSTVHVTIREEVTQSHVTSIGQVRQKCPDMVSWSGKSSRTCNIFRYLKKSNDVTIRSNTFVFHIKLSSFLKKLPFLPFSSVLRKFCHFKLIVQRFQKGNLQKNWFFVLFEQCTHFTRNFRQICYKLLICQSHNLLQSRY